MKTARPFSIPRSRGTRKVRVAFSFSSWLLLPLLALASLGTSPSARLHAAESVPALPPAASPAVPSGKGEVSVPAPSPNESAPAASFGFPAAALPSQQPPDSVLNPDENVVETVSPLRLTPPQERTAAAYALYAQATTTEGDAGLAAAIPLYREALKQDPTYIPLYLKVSLYLLTGRRFADADTLLSGGLTANPDSPSLLASLALTREYEGQPAEALRLAARAKELAPAHLLAHRVAFETLRNQKKDADAIRLIRAASAVPVEKIPRAQDWAALARLYTELDASLNPAPPPLVNSASSKNKPSPIREQMADLILPFYEKAFAVGPPTRDLLRQRGEFAIFLDRKDEAYGYLKRASQLDDGSVEIYITLAGLCADLGKSGEAIDNYEKAYALQPDFPELWKVLAHLYATPAAPSLPQTDKAAALLEDVLRRNPTELEAALALGDLYSEQNPPQFEKAELNLRQALILSLSSPKTTSPLFHMKLALLLMRENRLEETAAVLREAEQRFPQSARIPYLEGIVARNRKQPKDAIDYFAKARTMAKDQEADLLNGEFYCELSIAQEQAGQIAQSEETLKQGLTVEPENPNLLNALAYLWADQNRNLNDALKYSRRSIELKPGQGEYMDTLGWIEYRLGQYSEAATNLQKAADITGGDSTVLNHLADTLVKLGKADDAKKILQKIVAQDPDNSEAQKKLGTAPGT